MSKIPMCINMWRMLIASAFFSPNDFRFGKMSSSIESDRGSLLNALNVFERQDELVSIPVLVLYG